MGKSLLFFELLQIAVGTRHDLSFIPSVMEWGEAFDTAKKQAVVGVCFKGVQCAIKYDNSKVVNLSPKTRIQWLAITAKIQSRNEMMNRRCAELYDLIKSTGYKSCVLKGQAVAIYYDKACVTDKNSRMSMLRQSGDIDMWMVADVDKVIRWARQTNTMFYYDYHHADLSLFSDTEIELHYRPSISRNLWRNSRMQKWFKKEGQQHIIYNEQLKCCVPDDVFSLILTLNHNLWHLLYEGVGLRQMMDLYYVSSAIHSSNKTSYLLNYFHLDTFASASAWVLWYLFDRCSEHSLFVSPQSPLPSPNEDSGRFLLEEIMKAGNFGHYDIRLKAGRYSSNSRLMLQWLQHTIRLLRFFPKEVAWTPFGILYISFWRRFSEYKEKYLIRYNFGKI